MFTNLLVTHKKYGSGQVTAFEMNALDELNSRLTVAFDSGEIKKFQLHMLQKFFTFDSPQVSEYLEKLNSDCSKKKALNTPVVEIPKLKVWEMDEIGNPVSTEMWQKAHDVAGEARWPHESRAVVANNEELFINAVTGLVSFGLDYKQSAQVYRACEFAEKRKKNRYEDISWRYATRDDIYDNCLKDAEV